MTIKVKPQGTRFKKFQIWTKMTNVSKPQGPKWQFTLSKIYTHTHTCQVFGTASGYIGILRKLKINGLIIFIFSF
ncbi:hypothetical protein Hanom_Chr11g00995651 [Helianthus anomalus]